MVEFQVCAVLINKKTTRRGGFLFEELSAKLSVADDLVDVGGIIGDELKARFGDHQCVGKAEAAETLYIETGLNGEAHTGLYKAVVGHIEEGGFVSARAY